MSETIGCGFSFAKDPKRAGQESAHAAMEQLRGTDCHSCLVFSSVGYPVEILMEAIRKEVGNVKMAGCSGEGIIGPGIADESNHSAAVMVIADPLIRLNTFGCPNVGNTSDAVHKIGNEIKGKLARDSRCILLFPCGLNVIADEFISMLEAHLASDIPIIGGLAGDNHIRNKTYQYHDWHIYEDGVSAAILSGDFRLINAVSHGCVPIGTEMEITRANGNRLYEINNRPVIDIMAEYVGEDIRTDFGKLAVHFCIGQEANPEIAQLYDPFIIRFIARQHPEDKSISLPVKMQNGDKIWLTRRDREKMFQGARRSVKQLLEAKGDSSPFMVLHFDCAGRGKIMLSEQDKLSLIESFQKEIAPDTPWIGFFTYGEFCPVGSRNVFHNYTAVITVFLRGDGSDE